MVDAFWGNKNTNEKQQREDQSRYWAFAASGQGMPGISAKHSKKTEQDFPGLQRGQGPDPSSQIFSHQECKIKISDVITHPVHGIFRAALGK